MPDISQMSVERVREDDQEDFNPEVDGDAPNVDVVVTDAIPTIDVPVMNAAGRVVRINKVRNKAAIFCLRKPLIFGRAAVWCKRPSGQVLITDKTGALLARFDNVEQAEKHLKACGVDCCKLINFPKPAQAERAAARAAKGKRNADKIDEA